MGSLLVFLGGGLGALLRHGANSVALRVWGQERAFFGTLLINVTGSLLMGGLMQLLASRTTLSPQWRLLCATGFLGGFTTFSAYSYEVISLWDKGRVGGAVLYALVSVLAAALALALAARWTRAWLS